MQKQGEPIARATALLSTLLHCKKQAEALRACKRAAASDAYGRSCDAKEAAFITCSNEHIGLVIQHLVKIADKHVIVLPASLTRDAANVSSFHPTSLTLSLARSRSRSCSLAAVYR
jgi:hypothetical protein